MSSERPEDTYEPVLRLDYEIKAPGFFSYVRWAVRGKTANFETLVSSKIFDTGTRDRLIRETRSAAEAFEKSVREAEGVADKRKQSDKLSLAVSAFNVSMKNLDVRLAREVRLQTSGKIAPRRPFSAADDDFHLRSADAARFLSESGI